MSGNIGDYPTYTPTKQEKEHKFIISIYYFIIIAIGVLIVGTILYKCCKGNENKKRMIDVFAEA